MAGRASKKSGEFSHLSENEIFTLTSLKSQNLELSRDLAECRAENASLKARLLDLQREQLESRYEWEKEYHNLSNIVINMESVLRKSLNKTTDLSNDFASLMSLCQIASSLKESRGSTNVGSVRVEPLVKDKAHVVNPHMVNGHILHVPTIRLTRVTDSQDILPHAAITDNNVDNDISVNDSINETNNVSFQRRSNRQDLLNLSDLSDLDEELETEELRNSRSRLSTIEEELETEQSNVYENHSGVFSGVVDLKVYLNQITPEQMAYLQAPRVSQERNIYQCRPSMSERDRRDLLPSREPSSSAGPSGLSQAGSRPESLGATTSAGADKANRSTSRTEDDSSDDDTFSTHLSKMKVMKGLGLTLSSPSPLKEKNNLTPSPRTRRKLRISRNPNFVNFTPSTQSKNSSSEFKDCENQQKTLSPVSKEKLSKSPAKRRLFSPVQHTPLGREEKKRRTDESPSTTSSSSDFVTLRRAVSKSLYVKVEQLDITGISLPEPQVEDNSESRVSNVDREYSSDCTFNKSNRQSTSKGQSVKQALPKKEARKTSVSTQPRGRPRKLESPRRERNKSESDSSSSKDGRRNSGSLTPRGRPKTKTKSKITVKTKTFVSAKIQKRRSNPRKPSMSDEDTSDCVSPERTSNSPRSPPRRPVRSSRPKNLKEPSIVKKMRRP